MKELQCETRYANTIAIIDAEIKKVKAMIDDKQNEDIWYELNDYLYLLETDKNLFYKLAGVKQ
jgi:hypothetical protein